VTNPTAAQARTTWLSGEDPNGEFDPMDHCHVTLRDGTRVLIRPITTDDAELERRFIQRLSAESREGRFLGQINADDETIRKLTAVDYTRDMAFVALRQEGERKSELGVARYCVSADRSSCECTVVVTDDWQKRGLGHLLMRHLIRVARQRGIMRMFSIDASSNEPMRRLAADLGFERHVDPEYPGEVVHTLYL
jgi:GNAT superfamily N-acetyltransferase